MSTFGGKIKEIPGISVDRFDEENLDSDAYFLSHCHTDHMVGLNNAKFQETLRKRGCYIYVSHVSKAILQQLHPEIRDRIRELDFHTTTPIYLKNVCISVIPIPSGHCPGSVMFLFEGNKTVLYTGDFRMKIDDIRKIRAFYDSTGEIKGIHSLYLDTTFFFRDYNQFPSREESLCQIITLIEEWIALGEKHIIHLSTKARYGYEFVFCEIFKKIRIPVHINKREFDFYSLVPSLDGAVTLDASNTKIHCNCGDTFQSICKNEKMYNLRTIKLSAMRWTTENLKEDKIINNSETYFVCYSTHASYTEVVDLIKFLKPLWIHPCVLRFNRNDEEIYSTINDLLETKNEPIAKKPKLFDLKKVNNFKEESSEDKNEKYDSLFDEALDSPPETHGNE